MIGRHHGVVYLWLAAVFMATALAGCEPGDLSFDHSSGTSRLPIGDGSHE